MKKKKPNMFQKYLRRAVAALCIICVVLGTPVHAFAESGGSSPDELIDEESAENTSESTDTAESREELISEDSSAEDTSATDFSTENSSAGVTVSSTDELIEESNENITQADSLSDGETLVDESAEENSSENTSAQIRRSTMRIRRAMTAQNTAAPSFTITHEAGADSKFSNGSSENKVTYTLTHHDTSITKYSHTSNIDDTGGNDGSYATDFSTTDIITIPGATKLTIDVWYSTDSSDWLAIYPAGITPSDSNYASASISGGKLSGGGAYSKSDATHKQFTVNGDTAQFYFKSNSSWFKQGTYGYYATITADGYDSYDATSGTYEDPIPDNSQNSFLGWYTDASYSSKIEDPISLKTNSTVYAKIARYTDTGTWGTCPWGITKDGILEIGAGTGGEQTWVYGSITSPWKAYSDKIIAIKAIGAVKAPSNCAYLFDGLSKVTSADLKDFDTGKVTDMFRMFYECKSLTSLDANGWNTSKVTDMSWMFHGCESLTSLDVSGWNTSKVTDMIRMFYGCNALTSLDVSGWNTGNMTTMNYMFSGCSALTDIDLKKFFANVPQDRLMSLVHDIINDGDTESLIRKYLKAGVM
ncbi:MAG: BspA family leucine-rich repeat surface protein, partial [Oribacterium sp.]|nr:BspA family leucine-rich repeat surface protein [Oribacterium sp.]